MHLIGAALRDRNLNNIAPLANWLLLAKMRSTEDQPSVLAQALPTVSLANPTYNWNILVGDLPGIIPTLQQQQDFLG